MTKKRPHSPPHTERLLIAACLLVYAMRQARFKDQSSVDVHVGQEALEIPRLVMKDPTRGHSYSANTTAP
ncbi:hypothetical protein Tco_1377005 [Tanacetum coccineum]